MDCKHSLDSPESSRVPNKRIRLCATQPLWQLWTLEVLMGQIWSQLPPTGLSGFDSWSVVTTHFNLVLGLSSKYRGDQSIKTEMLMILRGGS